MFSVVTSSTNAGGLRAPLPTEGLVFLSLPGAAGTPARGRHLSVLTPAGRVYSLTAKCGVGRGLPVVLYRAEEVLFFNHARMLSFVSGDYMVPAPLPPRPLSAPFPQFTCDPVPAGGPPAADSPATALTPRGPRAPWKALRAGRQQHQAALRRCCPDNTAGVPPMWGMWGPWSHRAEPGRFLPSGSSAPSDLGPQSARGTERHLLLGHGFLRTGRSGGAPGRGPGCV